MTTPPEDNQEFPPRVWARIICIECRRYFSGCCCESGPQIVTDASLHKPGPGSSAKEYLSLIEVEAALEMAIACLKKFSGKELPAKCLEYGNDGECLIWDEPEFNDADQTVKVIRSLVGKGEGWPASSS